MVGSGEYSSGVCLQSGRRMSEGLLKDELSVRTSVLFYYGSNIAFTTTDDIGD